MLRKITLVITAILGFSAVSRSQVSIQDSAIFTPIIYATYSYMWPGGDLAERFGSNSSIGGGFMLKTSGNWLFGVEGNFMFGQTVKNSDSLLKSISTSNGFIIDANGLYADLVY